MTGRLIALSILWLLQMPGQRAPSASDSTELLKRAVALADAYNWSEAGPYFVGAERLALLQSDRRAALYAQIGALRSSMEQHVLAEISVRLENELSENPLLRSDDELRIFTLQVKGDVDFEIDASLARKDWEEVLAIATRTGNQKWRRRASGELGLVAFLEGDMLKARQLVGSALIEATTAGDVGSQVRYLGAIGTALSVMKDHKQALERLNQALDLASKNPIVGYSFPTQEAKIQALSGLNRLDEAYALANDVIEQARRRGKRVKEAQAYISMGNISVKMRNDAQAEESFLTAAKLSRTGGFTRLLAGVNSDLAVLKQRTGDLQAAASFAAEAAELTQDSGDLYLFPDRLFALASVKVSLGEFQAAKEIFARATEAVDVILSSTSRPSVRAALIHSMSAIFMESFLLHAKHLNDLPGAWAVVERNRARTTRDLLMDGAPRLPSSSPEVAKLRLELLKARTAPQLEHIRERIFLAETERLTANDRRLVIPVRTVEITELQDHLTREDVVLEYVLTASGSYCFVITKSSARLVPLPPTSTLDPTLLRYHEAILRRHVDTASAQTLYRMLLQPVSTELGKHKRVWIARHGALHLVPFESFIGNDRRYAVTTHIFSYIPSATTFVMLRQRGSDSSAEPTFLGVGGVPYDTSPLPKIAATRGFSMTLGNLPGSAEEVTIAAEELKRHLPRMSATMLVGESATETLFKQHAAKFRIVHLAVHAKANRDRPTEAALILLSDPKAGDDGFLQANEILDLGAMADLVLLSACDTAVGKLMGEDGIANLAQSFLAAGSKTVISTLWEADDSFSSTLVRRFYRYLGSGQSAGNAMANAKRDVIKMFGQRAGPWLWAPFIVEGADTSHFVALSGGLQEP